jgi:quercetin dioxygenase-like cupin family protein
VRNTGIENGLSRRLGVALFAAWLCAAVPSAANRTEAASVQPPRGATLGILSGRPKTPGITRTSAMVSPRGQAVHVRFEPGAAEPVHQHDHDVILVAVDEADVELIIGGKKTTHVTPGQTLFIPAHTDHQLANRSGRVINFVAISLN